MIALTQPRVSPPLACEAGGDPRIWIESARHGWWYSAPLPDGSLVAVYLTDADLVREQRGVRAAWQNALEQASGLKSRLGAASLTQVDHLRVVRCQQLLPKGTDR